MSKIKKPDYFRFLLIKTSASGQCEILYNTDSEEMATRASIEALKSYAEEIEQGACRIDLYNIY